MKPVFAIIVSLAMLMHAAAHAETVTVLTSFPKEITETYKKAFERTYPGTTVEVVSKSTGQAISLVKDTAHGSRPDVMWASAPDVFEVLARDRFLEAAPEVRNPAVPPRIGKYPMDGPNGMYFGQALSGYGIMWNKPYLQKHKLPTPAQWSDLVGAAYFGHVAMSSPARSGTTHLTVETILQGEGWDAGWRQLLQIAGNCATITARSTDVPEGVVKGQFGIGLVIDFFGLSAKYSGAPVDFTYPTVTAVVPASIALIAGGKNSAAGRKFMSFALSRKGQELLLEPGISRIPVMMRGDFFDSVPGTYPNIFGVALRAKVTFDPKLAQSRFQIVSQMFEESITLTVSELQHATKAIHDAEHLLRTQKHSQAEAMLQQARILAYTPPLSELELGKILADAGKAHPVSGTKGQVSSDALLNLRGAAQQRYRQARALAQEAAALVVK